MWLTDDNLAHLKIAGPEAAYECICAMIEEGKRYRCSDCTAHGICHECPKGIQLRKKHEALAEQYDVPFRAIEPLGDNNFRLPDGKCVMVLTAGEADRAVVEAVDNLWPEVSDNFYNIDLGFLAEFASPRALLFELSEIVESDFLEVFLRTINISVEEFVDRLVQKYGMAAVFSNTSSETKCGKYLAYEVADVWPTE